MFSHYMELSLFERKHYDKFLFAMQQGDFQVMAIGVCKLDTLQKIVTAINYDHPEILYVDFQHINCAVMPMGMVYHIQYLVSPIMRGVVIKDMEEWIEKVLVQAHIKKSDTVVDICRKIHNYLIKHVRYSYVALQNPERMPEAFTVKGVFESGEAVCEGISKAFKLLAERAGVDIYIMKGISSMKGMGQSIPHAWNVVKIEEGYAHIDVTWDLGISETSKFTRYDYFMVPDEWIQADHVFSNKLECVSAANTYFVRKKCLFNGIRPLKIYLEKKCKEKSSIIYFKIIGKNGFPDDITNKVQKLAEKMAIQSGSAYCSIIMIPNEEQNIFFFKMGWQ